MFITRFFRRRRNWPVLILALGLIVVALAGEALAPYDPLAVETAVRFQPPGAGHWLGTDNLGRDLASRILAGTRLALQSCLVILSSATLIGVVVGCLAGYYGGLIDEALMRVSDIFIAFPGLVLALAIAAALGPNLTNAMIAISAVWWPSYARLVRGQVLALKEREFILAARGLGASDFQIITRHLLPNVLTPLVIYLTSDIGPALVTTSSLSFIGMGAQPPTPEWGALVSAGRQYLLDYWWLSTFPGAAILVTVLIFNQLGEGIREALQVRA